MESQLNGHASEKRIRDERIRCGGNHSESLKQKDARGESVLVVDDLPELRQLLEMILTTLGYKVNAVSCGEDAVEYLKRNRADILVLDMMMDPGIDGLETYRQIKKMNPMQKAIMVSGFAQKEKVAEAIELGVGAYVEKPCTMERIGTAIRQELDRIR